MNLLTEAILLVIGVALFIYAFLKMSEQDGWLGHIAGVLGLGLIAAAVYLSRTG